METPSTPTSGTTLLDNDFSSIKQNEASTPTVPDSPLDGDSHNVYPPGWEVIFVCKYSHLRPLALSYFFLPKWRAGMVGIGMFSVSRFLVLLITYHCDQQPSSRSYSISMRSKSTSSSLVGEVHFAYNRVGYVNLPNRIFESLISSTHLRLTEYFEYRNICISHPPLSLYFWHLD